MAVTKTIIIITIKLGARVKAPNDCIGTVCRITDYKDLKYDYKTASVRFDYKSVRSRASNSMINI